MSDNNNQNYENFNQYPQPAQPININGAPMNGAYNPGYVVMVDDSAADKAAAKKQGIWSIVLGIISFCCCPLLGFVGLGLAISGLKKDKGNGACIAGLIVSIIGILMLVVNVANNLAHPEQMQNFMQQYNQMLEQMQGQMQSQAQPQPGIFGIFF